MKFRHIRLFFGYLLLSGENVIEAKACVSITFNDKKNFIFSNIAFYKLKSNSFIFIQKNQI